MRDGAGKELRVGDIVYFDAFPLSESLQECQVIGVSDQGVEIKVKDQKTLIVYPGKCLKKSSDSMLHCGTVDSFLVMPDESKREWFVSCVRESTLRKKLEQKLDDLSNLVPIAWRYANSETVFLVEETGLPPSEVEGIEYMLSEEMVYEILEGG